MTSLHLHIISFDIPYPPNYGGVIDVFYKIKALSEAGVKIHLHCFEYGRERAEVLKKYCISVNYYKRYKSPKYLFSPKPFIVETRADLALLENLLKDDYPILFEGLHTTAFLDKEELAGRLKLVRAHNVEHDYYQKLAENEKNPFRKLFFKTESEKLKRYENVLKSAQVILAISEKDEQYFSHLFENVKYIPPFHSHDKPNIGGSRSYAFYHGNLSVNENKQALAYLLTQVFSKTNIPLVVAGKNADRAYAEIGVMLNNVKIVPNPDFDEMEDLAKNASVHVLPTFQDTGFKLKLLHSLYTAPAVVVNPQMVAGTPLGEYCVIANSAQEMIAAVEKLHATPPVDLQKRTQFLSNHFSNQKNALVIKTCLKFKIR